MCHAFTHLICGSFPLTKHHIFYNNSSFSGYIVYALFRGINPKEVSLKWNSMQSFLP